MKKTKLELKRRTLRALTPVKLAEVGGGGWPSMNLACSMTCETCGPGCGSEAHCSNYCE